MKAKELMIGDWVAYRHKYMLNPLLCEVISIDVPHGELVLRHLQSEKVDEFGNKYYKVIKTRYEDVFAIPLTAEILEKNGWSLKPINEKASIWCHPDIPFHLSSYLKIWEFDMFSFNYIHELQHALRLCGLNELADNFKIN